MSDPKMPLTPSSPPPEDRTRHLSFQEVRQRKRELLAELSGHPATENGEPEAGAAEQQDLLASKVFEEFQKKRPKESTNSGSGMSPPVERPADSVGALLRDRDLLTSLGVMSGSMPAPLRLPEVGEERFGFRLCQELGRGAFGRVYLAQQDELAGRPVVLKVTEAVGDEARTLAQLQHTHIVPIYSVHEDRTAGLRGVCMPYFGGASLSHVLHELRSRPSKARTGGDFLAALAIVDSQAAEARPEPAEVLTQRDYLGITAWVIARLAEGLQHAHERGVLHRDIKPSNVLIASDGQPLLLDFNLAQDLKEDITRAGVGGTVSYMAPEHLRALAARDPVLARLVDRRSDIYSLGMVLFEMLADRGPFEQSASTCPLPTLIQAMAVERSRAAPSVRSQRPEVPWSLESIVRRCLSPNPETRYQHARELAADLDAFLADRPLRYAPELSTTERMRKWFRRHPRLTSSGSVGVAAAVLLLATAGALVGARGHLAQAREELSSQELVRNHQGLVPRALRIANTTEGPGSAAPESVEVLREALEVHGVLSDAKWQERPAWQRLGLRERHRFSEDIRELLVLLAWALTQPRVAEETPPPGPKGAHDPSGSPESLRQALALLHQAETIAGLAPSQAVAQDRARYLERLGEFIEAREARVEAEKRPPGSARDYYLIALADARSGRQAEALAALDEALHRDPGHYWSLCLRGLCHQQRGEHTQAIAAFSVCLDRAPESWAHLNRGYSYHLLGARKEAITDYTAALNLESTLNAARLNRGAAFLETGRFAEALEDFQAIRRAVPTQEKSSTTPPKATSQAWLMDLNEGLALEGVGKGAEADVAFARALEAVSQVSQEQRLLTLTRYGIAVARRLPIQAEGALASVLSANPEDVTALYGLAGLRAEGGELEKALSGLDQALDLKPDFLEARRVRAVVLARLNRADLAGKDINICLGTDSSGMTLYTAACICSLGMTRDPGLARQALDFLTKAIRAGYGEEKARQDPDLKNLQSLPEFQTLVKTGLGP